MYVREERIQRYGGNQKNGEVDEEMHNEEKRDEERGGCEGCFPKVFPIDCL